jgi:predicted negative regulator of RcsB-dependent stress response
VSEARFLRALDEAEHDSVIEAELATQLARSLGMQARYDEADALLDAIENQDAVVQARTSLERGRLRTSSGHPDDAIPLFKNALAAASSTDCGDVLLDAAYMLAIAALEVEAQLAS